MIGNVPTTYTAMQGQTHTHTSSGPEIPREEAAEPRCGEMPDASYI